MKKFILRILVFLGIILSFNFFLFQYSYDNYYGKYYKKPNAKYKSFLFADSHGAYLGKITQKYDVYNFSSPSESYLDIKRKLNYLIDQKYKIDTVYISLDDNLFSQSRDLSNNNDKSIIYTSKNDYSNLFIYYWDRFFKFYFPIFNTKISSFIKANTFASIISLISPKSKSVVNIHLKDWYKLEDNIKKQESLKRKDNMFSIEKSIISEKNLIEIISICKNKNIKIIGIKFPLTRSFIKEIDQIPYSPSQIFIKYKIPFLDFEKLYVKKDFYFTDQDHLNEIGGKEFVKIVFDKNNIKAYYMLK